MKASPSSPSCDSLRLFLRPSPSSLTSGDGVGRFERQRTRAATSEPLSPVARLRLAKSSARCLVIGEPRYGITRGPREESRICRKSARASMISSPTRLCRSDSFDFSSPSCRVPLIRRRIRAPVLEFIPALLRTQYPITAPRRPAVPLSPRPRRRRLHRTMRAQPRPPRPALLRRLPRSRVWWSASPSTTDKTASASCGSK